MERSKYKFLILLACFIFSGLTSNAQKKDLSWYRCALFDNYRAGNMAPWPGLIAEMEKTGSTELEWQIEIVKALYGLVGYQIGLGEKERARVYVDKADKYLNVLLGKYPRDARIHSLAGAFYGYKISLAFYKAPFFGPKSLSHIDKAIELDDSEPMGYIEKGNSLMYRPAAFGGDKNEGLELYRKALSLMDANKVAGCNWQKLLVRAFILKGLYETNREAEAKIFAKEMEKEYGSMNWIQKFVGAKFMEAE